MTKVDMNISSPIISQKRKTLSSNGAVLTRTEHENGVIFIDEMFPDSHHMIACNYKLAAPRGEDKLVPVLSLPQKDFVDFFDSMN